MSPVLVWLITFCMSEKCCWWFHWVVVPVSFYPSSVYSGFLGCSSWGSRLSPNACAFISCAARHALPLIQICVHGFASKIEWASSLAPLILGVIALLTSRKGGIVSWICKTFRGFCPLYLKSLTLSPVLWRFLTMASIRALQWRRPLLWNLLV